MGTQAVNIWYCKTLGSVDIELFASTIIHKLDKYVSWKQLPRAFNCDAFTLNWVDMNAVIFPLFSLMLEIVH